MLVPLDGSEFAERALPVATGMVATLDGELALMQSVSPNMRAHEAVLMVDGPTLRYLSDEADILSAEAKGYLTRLAGQLREDGLRVMVDVRAGSPGETILTAVRDLDVAMVVMATHARTGASRVLLGSVADAVLRHGDVPLLLAPPRTASSTADPLAPDLSIG